LLVAACSEPPLAPQYEVGFTPPTVEFALIDDTASFRGPLLDSVTIVVPANGNASGSRVLWSLDDVNDYGLIEMVSNITLDNRTLSARELLSDPANPILYYRSDGELVFHVFEVALFAAPPGGGLQLQIPDADQTGDSIVLLDTTGADHGMRLEWIIGTGWELDFNGFTDGEPPSCAFDIGFICYPAPAFEAANISDSPPSGTITIRAFRGAAEAAAFSLTLATDTTDLHPWVRYFEPFEPVFIEPGRLPGNAGITITTRLGGQAVADQAITG
jgi:hypothetical protein